VRSFPRAARRRAGGLLALTILTVAGLAAPNAAADGDHRTPHALRDQRQRVHHQASRTAADLEESSAALRRARAALAAAQTKLTHARATLTTLDGRLADARAADAALRTALRRKRSELAAARHDLASGRKELEDQRAAARDQALASYSQAAPSLQRLSALMGGSLADLTREQAYGEAVTGTQQNALQRLEATQAVLAVGRAQVQHATQTVAAEEQQAAAKVAEVEELRRQAVRARDAVRALVTARRHASITAARVEAHDQRQLARLRRREEEIGKQLLALAAKARDHRVAHTDGMFAAPVRGTYITSPYGWRLHPIYHYWGLHDGDDLHAPCGTPERAVGPGKVVSEYYSSVWGHRLYLDLGKINGHGYTAIYNHISRYRAPSVRSSVAARRWRTPAPPDGPPGATCTSPSCATARPSTRRR